LKRFGVIQSWSFEMNIKLIGLIIGLALVASPAKAVVAGLPTVTFTPTISASNIPANGTETLSIGISMTPGTNAALGGGLSGTLEFFAGDGQLPFFLTVPLGTTGGTFSHIFTKQPMGDSLYPIKVSARLAISHRWVLAQPSPNHQRGR
jgi:hypothetical protein